MEAEELQEQELINILFKVVWQCNKTQYNTYTVSDAPIFDSVKDLREFLFEKFKLELTPAADAESFRLGYMAVPNRRISITSSTQLAEAYSLVKKGFTTLWADPDVQNKAVSGKRSYLQVTCDDEDGKCYFNISIIYNLCQAFQMFTNRIF